MEQKSMTVRMPRDQADTLEAVARVEDLSVAEAIRDAIEAYIDARRQDKAFQERLQASLERNREILEQLALTDVSVALPRVASGKVREMFDAGEHLLMVATDRISVFDVVLPTPIPDKGAVLTGLSVFWFDRTSSIVPNHLVAWRNADFPAEMRSPELAGRSMLTLKAEMISLECVVRGYITGSGWKDYQKTGEVCGYKLPNGLLEAQALPEPLFTPSTKALTGHDENISVAQAKEIVGDAALVDKIADVSIRLYEHARDFAASKGIILADTKFEFGLVDGELTLCDEVFTPDSSRYWPADEWEPGTNPPSFDKQFVRDFVETINWNKKAPGPELPADVVAGTTRRYREAYEAVTGRSFDDYMKEASS
jgi:phosphoribosylaminoimidazole-succinocarboxamide synthase